MHHTPLTRRQSLQWAAALTAGTALPSFAQSDWPKDKTITFIVPFTAGSGTDVIARTVAEKLGPLLGAQIVIDNKTGAGGTVGAALVAKAPADGYTLLFNASTFTTAPMTMKQVPYSVVKDFAPVAPVAATRWAFALTASQWPTSLPPLKRHLRSAAQSSVKRHKAHRT